MLKIKNKMFKTIFLIFCLILQHKCWGQKTININSYQYDFSNKNIDNIKRTDFNFIDQYIENKKIILLGEEHHKISEFNYLKSNLIEYLINVKGYEVLLFENSIGETFYGLADKTKKLDVTTILKKKLIHPTWSVEENANLFQYIINQQNGIITGGIDPQIHTITKNDSNNTIFSKKILEQTFLSYKDKFNLFVLDSSLYQLYSRILKNLHLNKRSLVIIDKAHKVDVEKDILLLKQCLIKYKKIVNSCIQKFNKKEEKLFGLALINRLIFGEMIISLQSDNKSHRYDYIRDSIMAHNIVYIADSIYPNKKIIVWAHDYHIAKNPVNKNNSSSIGMFFKSDFKEKCYTIGLEMNGKYSLDGRLIIRSDKKNKNTLHRDLSKLGDAFFLDFKDAISQQTIKSKYKRYSNFYYNSHSRQMENQILKNKASTLNVFDAVFFIKNTHPSHFYNIFGYTQLD